MKPTKRDWNVLVTSHSVKITLAKKTLQKIASEILSERQFLKLPAVLSDVSVVFIADDEMQALNKQYRHKDKTTDVLSFPQQAKFGEKTLSPVLGDLVISAPTMRRQAREFGVTENEELLRLLVHGLLHLAGYDHERVPKKVADRMRRAERSLFDKYRALYFS